MNPKNSKPTIHKPTPAKPKKANATAMKTNHTPVPTKKESSGMGKKVGLGVAGILVLGLGGCGVHHFMHHSNQTAKTTSHNSDAEKSSGSLDFKSSKDDKKKKKDNSSTQSSAENNLNSILDSSKGHGSGSGNGKSSGHSQSASSSSSLNNLFNGTSGGSSDGNSLSALASDAKKSANIADVLGGLDGGASKAGSLNSASPESPSHQTVDFGGKGLVPTGTNGHINIPSAIANADGKGKGTTGTGSTTVPAGGKQGAHSHNGGNENHNPVHGNGGNSTTNKGGSTTFTKDHPNWDYTPGVRPAKDISLVDKNGKVVGKLNCTVTVTDKGNGHMAFTITYPNKSIPKGYEISTADKNALIDAYFGNGKFEIKPSKTAPDKGNKGDDKGGKDETSGKGQTKDQTHDSSSNSHLNSDNTMTVIGSVKPNQTQSYIKDFKFDGKPYKDVGAIAFKGDGVVTEDIALNGKDGKKYQITRTINVGKNNKYSDGDANTKVAHTVQLEDIRLLVKQYYNPAQPTIKTGNKTLPQRDSGVTAKKGGSHKASFRIGDTQFNQNVEFTETAYC